MEPVAGVIYGEGAELGSFKVFADRISRELKGKLKVAIFEYVTRDAEFFDALLRLDDTKRLKELHIFSHAMGAGIFLGYKDPQVQAKRVRALLQAKKQGRRVRYIDALNAEIGAIQTDDFKLGAVRKHRAALQAKFTGDAFIKIWGCNSGVRGWVYSDLGTTDPSDDSVPYYWRAFNERHTPKPSIAQAMATFFGVRVFGASSGANVQVRRGGKWISSKTYHQQVGHWPSGRLPHRLVPEAGSFREYAP